MLPRELINLKQCVYHFVLHSSIFKFKTMPYAMQTTRTTNNNNNNSPNFCPCVCPYVYAHRVFTLPYVLVLQTQRKRQQNQHKKKKKQQAAERGAREGILPSASWSGLDGPPPRAFPPTFAERPWPPPTRALDGADACAGQLPRSPFLLTSTMTITSKTSTITTTTSTTTTTTAKPTTAATKQQHHQQQRQQQQ